ncbi:MAG: type I-B CRISPR-associated protein Cas7/Cst2/DevR [Aquificae bacterium]|nr:type I-B CRISPR-associated protein Cas7/Cst2/DevR [Aquificota bacterium]
MAKLTGVFLIETGVVNRGGGIGHLATVKKVTTPEGMKVYFSPVSYKRALWRALQQNKGWSEPFVTNEGGIIQRTGTIIDSEEFDFGGTMIAAKKSKKSKSIEYKREAPFLVDNGISINNYCGDMELMTNMALSKFYGEDSSELVNRENFYGIYIMPFGIEIERVGIQEIEGLDVKIKEDDSLEEKIRKIYEVIPKPINKKRRLELTKEQLSQWAEIVDTIEYCEKTKTTKIVLKKEERERRLRDLLLGMGELVRRIEGSDRNLSPFFAAFSLDYIAPKYLYLIKAFVRKKINQNGYLSEDDFVSLSQELRDFAQREGKDIKTATYLDYAQAVDELIKQIFGETKGD